MSKYAKIAALVPQGEHFDESAIVNEGGWVSTGHLDAIEASLGTVPEGYVAQAELDAANALVTDRDSTISSLQTASAEKDATIAKHVATIAALSKRSSGPSGSQPKAAKQDEQPKEDKVTGNGKTLSINDPNHPQYAIAKAHKVGQAKPAEDKK